MTDPFIKREISPDWTLENDDLLPVVFTGYIHATYPFIEDPYESYTGIENCGPYGPLIDYTSSKIYSPMVQCISPSATTMSPTLQVPESSPPPPPRVPSVPPTPPPTPRPSARKENKRTCTSYDKETSLYLKSVFFDVYSKQKKLTKQQRLEVKNKTGLPSRNITYWFSNHKRRFKQALEIYKITVKNSHGKITCYDEFVLWRRSQNLPDDVTRSEMENV